MPWHSDRGQEKKRVGRIPYRDESGSRPRRRAGADAGATLKPFKAKAEPAGQTIEVKTTPQAEPVPAAERARGPSPRTVAKRSGSVRTRGSGKRLDGAPRPDRDAHAVRRRGRGTCPSTGKHTQALSW